MTATDTDALANATRGMSHDIAAEFARLPRDCRQAYLRFFTERQNRRAAHRDTLEAFAAGWTMRGQATPRRSRGAA
jgi:hypothetical protein